jgi:succinoglycan biosynthesis protein ExoM
VYERVVPSRVNFAWVAKRRYRAGQVRALVSYKFDRAEYVRLSWSAPLKVVLCVIMSVFTMPSRARAMWWLVRGMFHCGTISYAIGAAVYEEYGNPVKPN